MDRKPRRTDKDLVSEIIEYLQKHRGAVTRGDLCAALEIHPRTAEKWLEIGTLFLKKCPSFEYTKAGQSDQLGIITMAAQVLEKE